MIYLTVDEGTLKRIDPLASLLTIALANAETYDGAIEDIFSDWVQAGINDGREDQVVGDKAEKEFDTMITEFEHTGFITWTSENRQSFTLDESLMAQARKFWD